MGTPIQQQLSNKIMLPALSVLTLVMAGCGGGGGGSNSAPANKAPAVSAPAPMTVSTGGKATYQVSATDAEGQTLTYSIVTEPKFGKAMIDAATGMVTYTAGSVVGEDIIVVGVSDGTNTTNVTLTVNNQTEAVFDSQFYYVNNPETGNKQIVKYNPNEADASKNQTVIKKDVILGNRVFVISGDKDGDKTVYKKREYAVFLDPSASFETRTGTDRNGEAFEYKFYTNNILKRFDAADPSKEELIFTATQLGADLGAQGMAAIGDTYDLYVNPTDVDNSYVELRTFARLPDTIKKEVSGNIKNTYVTVRLSDSAVTQGRTIKPIVNNTSGKTDGVLVNYLAVSTTDSYPEGAAQAARLQRCDAALATCTELGDMAKGEFYFEAESSDYIYLNKKGSNKYYAFSKSDNSITEVTGVNFPAAFDPTRHYLGGATGHGGNSLLRDFSSIRQTHGYLAEGNKAYAVVNYNLDTKDGAWDLRFGPTAYPQYTFKNAMVVKFDGTTASKIYENGTGTDLGDDSDEVAIAEQLNLVAVKDDNVFVETGKYDAAKRGNVLASGWIKAGKTAAVNKLDTVFTSKVVPYFTAHNVPTVAVGESIYAVEVPTDNGAGGRDEKRNRIYNIYKVPLTDTNTVSSSLTPTRGRMFLERTANSPTGIYDGGVIAWNIDTSDVLNLTNDTNLGKAKLPTGDAPITNIYGGRLGNIVGIGGIFGMNATARHGGAVSLVSAKSDTAQSLKIVNTVQGAEWIFD